MQPRFSGSSLVTIVIVFVILLGFIALLSASVISEGFVGIKTTWGKADGDILNPGINFKIPIIQGVKELEVRTIKDESIVNAGTKDLQSVTSKVAVTYQVDKANAVKIYKEVGLNEEIGDRIIAPAIQEVVKASTAKYTAEELLTKRTEVKDLIDSELTTRLKEYGIKVQDASITDFTYSAQFDAAIEAKQVAEQDSKKAQYEKQKAIVQKEAELERAKIDTQIASQIAEKNRLESETLSDQIIRRMYIEKWNGVLPTYVGNGGEIFIQPK